VGVACRGFTSPARLVAKAEGLADMRLVEYPPPNIGAQRWEQIVETSEPLVELLVKALTTASSPGLPAAKAADTGSRKVVFRGDLREVNDFFRSKVWSDGLPIVPPTVEDVEEMLRFTGRSPQEVIGLLKPTNLPATVWKVAVNGVMAGCRPEYMPVLLAIAEAAADDKFGIEHVGSTVGLTPLIILNGPVIKELGFNSGQGVLRPQHQANITVSRFLRLLMVNVAGYRLGETDMATFGRNYYPVLAEAEDESPWPPMSVDRGFPVGTNLITLQSADTTGHSFLTEGPAESHLRVIAREMVRELGGNLLVAMEHFGGRVSPVLGLTPLIAGILSKAGYSKADVKKWLHDHALVSARLFDEQLARIEGGYNLKRSVERGKLPARFAESDDPDRLVPILHHPDELQIVVCGAPERNRTFICGQFGKYGGDVSKQIKMKKAH
jgi:hypothetical protein